LPANDRHAVPVFDLSGAKCSAHKEKLQIHAHIWYKVSRSERVSYNGITPASQADNEGSIPFTRSNQISVSRRFLTGDAGKEKTSLDGRFFCVWNLVSRAHFL
jgi:hypothetical protein